MSADYGFDYVVHEQIEHVASNLMNEAEKVLLQCCRNIIDPLQNKSKLDLLVFVVIRDEDYKAVKRFGDQVNGIPTQCMKLDVLAKQRNLDQYLGEIDFPCYCFDLLGIKVGRVMFIPTS